MSNYRFFVELHVCYLLYSFFFFFFFLISHIKPLQEVTSACFFHYRPVLSLPFHAGSVRVGRGTIYQYWTFGNYQLLRLTARWQCNQVSMMQPGSTKHLGDRMIVRDSNPATVPRMIQQADALSVAPFPLPCIHQINITTKLLISFLLMTLIL